MIKLNHSNYNSYIPINIIAFSFASSGAMGDPGDVKIMDKDGNLFYFNYVEGDLKENERYEICPMIKEIVSNKTPKESDEFNMKMGNYLYVHKSISQEVEEKTKDLTFPGQLFMKWSKVILGIIKK